MAMVGIRIVGMVVCQRLVVMRMHMRLAGIFAQGMVMQVMCIMDVRMCMALRAVQVHVRVVFRQMQPHAQSHQRAGSQELPGDRLGKKQYGHDSPYKWRG